MKRGPLFKYYKRATVLPFIGTLIGGITLVMLHDDKELQNLGSDDNYGDTIFFIILFSLTICILSATIFLSRFKQVTDNGILNAVAWMALPLSCTSFMLINQVSFLMEYLFDGWEHPPYEKEMQILFVMVCTGHLIATVLSYIQFRKSLKAPAKPATSAIKKKPTALSQNSNQPVPTHR